MDATYECDMTSLLVVLILENTRVYICSSNYYNVMAYVKISINKTFCIHAIL